MRRILSRLALSVAARACAINAAPWPLASRGPARAREAQRQRVRHGGSQLADVLASSHLSVPGGSLKAQTHQLCTLWLSTAPPQARRRARVGREAASQRGRAWELADGHLIVAEDGSKRSLPCDRTRTPHAQRWVHFDYLTARQKAPSVEVMPGVGAGEEHVAVIDASV